jgi:hypothetical protein
MTAGDILSLVRATCPPWFTTISEGGHVIEGTATIQVDGASRDFALNLRLEADRRGLTVREPAPGKVLPASCPERHVNHDGTFCVGYGAEFLVVDEDSARVWWGLLREFLKLQRVAARTRVWPPRQALSHGAAGPHHLAALDAARALGLEEAYYRMLEGEDHWFASPQTMSKDGRRLLNGRAPCPIRCVDRRGRPILRRSCCRKETVLALVASERARRKAEAEFWQEYREAGRRCCGKMRSCPLRQGESYSC